MKIAPAIFIIGLIVGTAIMMISWGKIDTKESAFAKDCNDRGGTARRIDGILQCVHAKEKLA